MVGRISQELQQAQAEWLKSWHIHMVNSMMSDAISALEVGSGCGYVMDSFRDILSVIGIDSSISEVQCANKRGMHTIYGDATALPFPDRSFDLVYANYLLMWNKNPEDIIEEMRRVSKKYVAILSEPYWHGAIYSPSSLKVLVDRACKKITAEGGNPDMGIALPEIMRNQFEDFKIGTVPLSMMYSSMLSAVRYQMELMELKHEKDEKITLFYVPTFWSIGIAHGEK